MWPMFKILFLPVVFLRLPVPVFSENIWYRTGTCLWSGPDPSYRSGSELSIRIQILKNYFKSLSAMQIFTVWKIKNSESDNLRMRIKKKNSSVPCESCWLSPWAGSTTPPHFDSAEDSGAAWWAANPDWNSRAPHEHGSQRLSAGARTSDTCMQKRRMNK